MSLRHASAPPAGRTPRTHGPPPIFFVAHVIAAFVIGLPLILYGIYRLQSGAFYLPFGRKRWLELLHLPAILA